MADGSLPSRDWIRVASEPPARTMAEILTDVAYRHNLRPATIRGPDRKRAVSYPRQEFMWEAWSAHRWTLTQIAQYLGDRDHTTILHGIRAHARRNRLLGP